MRSGPFSTRWVVVLATLALAPFTNGCRSKSPTGPNPPIQASAAVASDQLLLVGEFQRVAKAATGTARVVRRGNVYELQLNDVTVAQEGMVRVYLVGHEHPSSTRSLDDTELKYDMAELARGVAEQRIELPSEPDPALRSVVLFYPSFGVNLAFAPLRPPAGAH